MGIYTYIRICIYEAEYVRSLMLSLISLCSVLNALNVVMRTRPHPSFGHIIMTSYIMNINSWWMGGVCFTRLHTKGVIVIHYWCSSLPPPPPSPPTRTLPCSVAIHFPFSLGESIVLGILSAVSPFALIVYIRYSLIMAGCWLDNISMVPRTAIVSFAIYSNNVVVYMCK